VVVGCRIELCNDSYVVRHSSFVLAEEAVEGFGKGKP
jgi:hypothetical protein